MFSGTDRLRYNSPDFQASLRTSTLTFGSTQSTAIASAPVNVQHPHDPQRTLRAHPAPPAALRALAGGRLGFFGQCPPSSEPQTSFRPASLNPAC